MKPNGFYKNSSSKKKTKKKEKDMKKRKKKKENELRGDTMKLWEEPDTRKADWKSWGSFLC